MVDGKRATVLVVDDDVFVRMDLVGTLTAAGYPTREAGCSAEAIEVLEHQADIAVLFTDIQMPGYMDGLALAHYVRERGPPIVIVISSGNCSPAVDDLPSDAQFLAKPYSRQDFGRTLEIVESRLATCQSRPAKADPVFRY
jgi:CheY-like chemotaxis protein